jgi:hypothetical protein
MGLLKYQEFRFLSRIGNREVSPTMANVGLGRAHGSITSVSRRQSSGVHSTHTINSRAPITFLGCGST